MPTIYSVKRLFQSPTPTHTTIFNVVEDLLPFEKKIAWLETIKTSLCKEIFNKTDLEFVNMLTINGCRVNCFSTGKQLIELIDRSFYETGSLRIAFPGLPTRCWLIVLQKDAE